MSVIYAALGAMLAGNALLLLAGPHTPLPVIFIPMVLLGFSMGLRLGFIDGEALAAVPPHQSGAAAGLFNFLRFGSEAIAVGGYAAVVAFLIGRILPDPGVAQQVASGAPGHGAVYAEAFRTVQFGILALILAGGVAIALLHRARIRGEGTGPDWLDTDPREAPRGSIAAGMMSCRP